MSDTDSFIEEVTEEVRRERLYLLARRYGWIAVLAVILLVGGAAWHEIRKADARGKAEAFGDSIITALQAPERADRATALAQISAPTAGGQAVLDMLTAAEEGEGNPQSAAKRLLSLADNPDVPQVYRQLATLKAVMIDASGLELDTRRTRLEGLALSGGVTRLLAEEQLAMLEIEAGDQAAALARLQQIAEDAEATPGMLQRVGLVIVALGGADNG